MSVELFHSIVTFIWGLICLLMSVTLFVFNIPEKETAKAYRISVQILSLNYLILSLLVFCMVFLNLRNSPDDVFPFPTLLISTSQGIVFAYALILLYVPKNFAKKTILYYNVFPLSLLITMYVGFASLFGDPICKSIPDFFSQLYSPAILMRFLLLLFNVYQIFFFYRLVQKLSARYAKHLNHYYSDTIQLKPQWAKKSYSFAVMIGILAIISSLFKDVLIDSIFTIIFCAFYFLFAIMYMQYKGIFTKLEPDFIEDLERVNKVQNVIREEKKLSTFNWDMVKNHIIDQKLYLQSGISVNDMAMIFRTNRTTFSSMLNKNEGQNFNSFINQLRIEYAKQLLLENNELTMADIARECGYTEQSNFTRHFKRICNETPAVWTKKKI